MTQLYSINITNNALASGAFCVFQTLPDINNVNILSLAWLTKTSNPNTLLNMQWGIDYSFFWSDAGVLSGNGTYNASQTVSCDPTGNNLISLGYDGNAYEFSNLNNQGDGGMLMISSDGSIPTGSTATVGVAVAGKGAFVQPVQPNMNHIFSLTPSYWLAYGNYVSGQLMKSSDITYALNVVFPEACYQANVTINPDNSWVCDYI